MTRGPAAHEVFDSVEEMLEPTSLGRLLGVPPGPVTVSPMPSNGFSANEVSAVHMGDHRLVLKRLAEDDWMARAFRDDGCRSLTLWRTGLLDRLEPDLRHGIVAGSRDGAGHALLMRDCTAGLPLPDTRASEERLEQAVRAMVSMHARFWGDDSLDDPAFGLADLETLLTATWPTSWALLEDHPEPLALLERGWEALFEMVAPDVRRTIEQILAHPAALLRALESEPATLLHGDYRQDNVAVMPDGSVVALDWQLAARGPGVMDLAWQALSWEAIAVRDFVVDRYQEHLLRALGDVVEPAQWDRAVAIASLAEVLRKGNWAGLFVVQGMDEFREFFPVYDEAVRRGADLL